MTVKSKPRQRPRPCRSSSVGAALGADPARPHAGLLLRAFEEGAASAAGTMLELAVKDAGRALPRREHLGLPRDPPSPVSAACGAVPTASPQQQCQGQEEQRQRDGDLGSTTAVLGVFLGDRREGGSLLTPRVAAGRGKGAHPSPLDEGAMPAAEGQEE